jgi:transposase-like protein
MKSVVRYSESFKLQVLRELEEGRFESVSAVKRAYGIRGQATVKQWALQYGKGHLFGKVVRVERPEETDEKRRLRQRVRELEKALADAHLKQCFDEAYLKIACRAAGIEDVEGFKKKHGGKR